MKSSTKRVFALALVCAALVTTSTRAQRSDIPIDGEGQHFYRLDEAVPLLGIDIQSRGDEFVAIRVLQKDGNWVSLTRQINPTCPQSCPEQEPLSCWEDDEQKVSVCICGSPRTGKPYLRFRFQTVFTTKINW